MTIDIPTMVKTGKWAEKQPLKDDEIGIMKEIDPLIMPVATPVVINKFLTVNNG